MGQPGRKRNRWNVPENCTIIRRGELRFMRCGRNERNVICVLGDPDSPESEFMFEIADTMIDDVIAGLTAMKQLLR